MKETATPAEKREYLLMELKDLKSRQRYFKDTPPDQRKEMVKNNLEIRKEATKILKNYDDVNKFMYAKDWSSYENKINPKPFTKIADKLKNRNTDQFKQKISEAKEKGQLEDINKGRKGLNTIVYYNAADVAKANMKLRHKENEELFDTAPDNPGLSNILGVDDKDFKTPESEFMRVPEFLEKHYKPDPDPDVSKGLGSILKV